MLEKKHSPWITAPLVLLVFTLAMRGGGYVRQFLGNSLQHPVLNLVYIYSWYAIPPMVFLAIYFRPEPVLVNLGLHKNIRKAFVFAVLAVLPMLVSSAVAGKIDTSMSLIHLFRSTLCAGFFEELLFRGFLFGILFRRCQWGFIPAALIGAIIFGMGHLYQGETLHMAIGVFIATFMGAIWFAWLYIEWNNNLWVPIFLHILMNTSWSLFDVGETAMGTLNTNLFRIATIAITVILTILFRKREGTFKVNKRNLFWQTQSA